MMNTNPGSIPCVVPSEDPKYLGCRSKLKPVVCIVCLTTFVCMSLWLPFQHDGGEVA